MQPMRVAWFSPVPPVRSGIAAYTAEVVPQLRTTLQVDVYSESNAHTFLYAQKRASYDLTIYQLGNGRAHDYMWGYLVRFPGLTVLHDARLHHARARMLLAAGRIADYRAEFRYDHPDVPPSAAEYAIDGLGGMVHYLWPMLRVPVSTARAVAVHNRRVADDIATTFPASAVETIRMGVPAPADDPAASARLRTRLGIDERDVVFAAFGTVTPEKRIGAALGALSALGNGCPRTHLLIVGDCAARPELDAAIARTGMTGRVHIAGYVADGAIGDYLGAADACLCLRWPTALETSASWLRCIAAGRATVLSDLAHVADVPRAVALRVDVLDEERSLLEAVRALTLDGELRRRTGEAARAYWAAHHTVAIMAEDYRAAIARTAARPARRPDDLPRHLLSDHMERARATAGRFGIRLEILEPRSEELSRPD
jgi:glycosyltransferase involved in cell wall biosynthesis